VHRDSESLRGSPTKLIRNVGTNVKKMTRLTVFNVIIFLMSCRLINGQTPNDSISYWVNQKYLDCLDSGKSVCNCQEKNNYLILHIDTKKKLLTINPSIYFSPETFEFKIRAINKSAYSIVSGPGIDSGSTLNFSANQMILKSSKKSILFNKIRVKPLDNWIQGDLWKQLGVINCKPLLNYSFDSNNDSTEPLLSKKSLSEYISKALITISCSDDYHYNEMQIKDSNTEFFVIYDKDWIKIYRIPQRDRGQIIEIDKLKSYQLLNRMK